MLLAPHKKEKEAEPLGVGGVSRSALALAYSTSSVVSAGGSRANIDGQLGATCVTLQLKGSAKVR